MNNIMNESIWKIEGFFERKLTNDSKYKYS